MTNEYLSDGTVRITCGLRTWIAPLIPSKSDASHRVGRGACGRKYIQDGMLLCVYHGDRVHECWDCQCNAEYVDARPS